MNQADDLPGMLSLDTSVLINLLATAQGERVLKSLGCPCLIERHVMRELTRHPLPDACHVKEMGQLERAGLVRVVDMSDAAYETYLGLIGGEASTTLDDGESAAIALAVDMGAGVILDDTKARRVTRERYPQLVQISSLRLLLMAGRQGQWLPEELKAIVMAARVNGRMAILSDEQGDPLARDLNHG